MTMVGNQMGVSRVITGTKIPHPCGDPTLPEEADRALRRAIVQCALDALQTNVSGSTIFTPDVQYSLG